MNKKGMTTVFLTIVTGAVMTVVVMFTVLAYREATVSMTENVFNLAGRSVLSEFDKELKDRYGLIAYLGDSSEAASKLMEYADYSFSDDDDIVIENIDVDMKENCLGDRETFEEELYEYLEYELPKILLRTKDTGNVETGERTLRNENILVSLPSKGLSGDKTDTPSVINLVKNAVGSDSFFEAGTKKYKKMKYMFDRFYTGSSTDYADDSFFRDEVEYIIEGQSSDKDNIDEVKKDIIEIRTALNAAYIIKDEAKMAELLALAEMVTPGPEAIATRAAMVAVWAAAEAENDWRLLSTNRRVPLFKSAKSWATSSSVISDGSKKTVEPDAMGGFDYDDYLMILLLGVKDEVATARMMDLIEINIKGTYAGAFDLESCHTGFTFDAYVNGRKYSFDEKY